MTKYILSRDTMRSVFESKGDKLFAQTLIGQIRKNEIDLDSFNLVALWEAMGRPGNVSGSRAIGGHAYGEGTELFEAVESTSFPQITGELINAVVQEAYEKEYGIAEQLVRVLPSSQRDETLVGFTEDFELKEVPEGMPYQEGAIGEKYHKVYNTKWGRIIKVTDEMGKFDQTGQALERARRIGEQAKAKKERVIFDAVLELISSGNRAAWRPAGTATTLYSNTSTDPYTTATYDNLQTDTLSDETDIDAAMKLFSAATDEQGDPIVVNPTVLLTGVSGMATAAAIIQSGQFIEKTRPSGTYNVFSRMLQPLSTPYIDQLVGTGYWWIGDFKKQFVYTEVFPLQTFQAAPGNDYEFTNDITAAYKVRFMGGCGAITNRFVIKSGA